MSQLERVYLFKDIFKNIGQSIIYLKLKGSQVLNDIQSELNAEQFIVLYAISLNEDICQMDLAKIVLKDRANTSRIISYLEKIGFIDRLIGTKNNRLVKKILITEKGEKIIEKNLSYLNMFLLDVFKEISNEEAKVLLDGTQKLKNSLSKVVSIQI